MEMDPIVVIKNACVKYKKRPGMPWREGTYKDIPKCRNTLHLGIVSGSANTLRTESPEKGEESKGQLNLFS